MIVSVVKIVFTILFSFGINYRFEVANDYNPGESLYYGFQHFNDDTGLATAFYIQVREQVFGSQKKSWPVAKLSKKAMTL